MISGVFHVMSQEWRYFSREKAIVHTAHMAELAPFTTGQTVTIPIIPPTGTSVAGNFRINTGTFPVITPYRGLDITNVTQNVPPLWVFGFGFGALNGPGGPWPQPTGSYGISGTFQWPTLQDVEQDWWPSTGGTFLFLGGATTSQDSNGVMDVGSQVDLYNGTSMPSHTGNPILQEANWFMQQAGDNWFLAFHTAAGGTVETTILKTIPPFNNLDFWIHASNYFNNGIKPFFNFETLMIRLGP